MFVGQLRVLLFPYTSQQFSFQSLASSVPRPACAFSSLGFWKTEHMTKLPRGLWDDVQVNLVVWDEQPTKDVLELLRLIKIVTVTSEEAMAGVLCSWKTVAFDEGKICSML